MMKKNMLGIFSWFGFVLPMPERLRLIKEAGFDATSVWWEDEKGEPEIKKEQFPDLIRDSGLFLENIHVPFNNSNDLWSADKGLRARSLKEHMVWLEDCARYNIPLMVMHLTEGPDPPASKNYGVESLWKMTELAEKSGVKIAVENTRRADNVLFILSAIQSDYLGLCYDSSHANLYSDKGEALLTRFGHRLLATHLSDNDGLEDKHWLPRNGQLDWQCWAKWFPSATYQGNLTLEIYPTEEEMKKGPAAFIVKAFQKLSWVRSQLEE